MVARVGQRIIIRVAPPQMANDRGTPIRQNKRFDHLVKKITRIKTYFTAISFIACYCDEHYRIEPGRSPGEIPYAPLVSLRQSGKGVVVDYQGCHLMTRLK